jgi:hypothetical protein
MKPGYMTSEFWISVTTQILAFLVVTHAISPQDQEALGGALAKMIAAVFTICTSGRIIVSYIQSRTTLKRQDVTKAVALMLLLVLAPASFAQSGSGVRGSGAVSSMPVAVGAQRTCLFRRSDPQVVKLLEQVLANQQVIMQLLQDRHAPPAQQPQVIVLSPPLQNIPLGGMPYQQIPLGGLPRQDIPLGGPPLQNVPLGTPPGQQIPLGGQPKQQIDQGAMPKQSLPLGTPPGMVPPG